MGSSFVLTENLMWSKNKLYIEALLIRLGNDNCQGVLNCAINRIEGGNEV